MAKAFTVASWNVEHFKADRQRVERIVQFLSSQSPDVFALYEVEGKEVFESLVAMMPDYHFHITEGPQTQEILVGARSTVTAFFTQKLEFKSGNTYLRPGALLTVTVGDVYYPVLFLHTKSGSKPIGLGIRDDMFHRALTFRRTLDGASPDGRANYIFLGDLNTMGMVYPFKKQIGWDIELKKLDSDAKRRKMRRLTKNKPETWWNGTETLPPSNIDHVLAAQHLNFEQSGGADIKVIGWPEKETVQEQRKWIKEYSDHALLFFQVERV